MGSEELVFDISAFLSGDERTAEKYDELRGSLCRSRALQSELADLASRLADDPSALGKKLSKKDATARGGIAQWLLGRLRKAEKLLTEAKDAGVELELGACRLELGLFDGAIEALAPIDKGDPRHGAAALMTIEAETKAGRSDKSLAAIEKIVKSAPSADACYQLGLALDAEGRSADAVQAYEQALELDPDHHRSTFRLGYTYVLAGDPEAAIGHYKRLADHHPPYPTALLNLGMLYEDKGEGEAALDCYKRVMDACPGHHRATLCYQDAAAALDMYYDPEEQKERSRKDEILSIPITDFELSVRSRNCLAKMNILSLGDLVIKTEEELLSYKNFGETSLTEIKEMLAIKGLTLGADRGLDRADEPMLMLDDDDDEDEDDEPETDATSDEDDIMARTTIDLQLSVRCRKCLERLNITTVGALTRVTEDELLSVRNFGRTSLDEIRTRLAAHGLALSDGSHRGRQ